MKSALGNMSDIPANGAETCDAPKTELADTEQEESETFVLESSGIARCRAIRG